MYRSDIRTGCRIAFPKDSSCLEDTTTDAWCFARNRTPMDRPCTPIVLGRLGSCLPRMAQVADCLRDTTTREDTTTPTHCEDRLYLRDRNIPRDTYERLAKSLCSDNSNLEYTWRIDPLISDLETSSSCLADTAPAMHCPRDNSDPRDRRHSTSCSIPTSKSRLHS